MDNTPNEIFNKDNNYIKSKNLPPPKISSPTGHKGIMHNHTIYSIYDGAQTPLELVRAAKVAGYKNVCLSDHGSLMALAPFLKACKDEEINGIVGVELYVTDKAFPEMKRGHMCIYAKDNEGLQSIIKILAESFKQYEKTGMTTKKYYPITSLDILKKHVAKSHVFVTTACVTGVMAQTLCGNKSILKEYNKIISQMTELEIDKVRDVIKEVNTLELKKEEIEKEINSLKTVSLTPYKEKLKLIPKKEKERIEQGKEFIKKIQDENKRRSVKKKELKESLVPVKEKLKEKKPKRTEALKIEKKYLDLEEKLKNVPFVPEKDRKGRTLLLLKKLIEIFGKQNFFIELQYHGLEDEKIYYPKALEIAKEYDLKTVVANDAHYDVKGKEFKRWLLSTSGLITYYNMISVPDDTETEYYVKTEDELRNKLSEIIETDEINKAIQNTYDVLSECHVEIDNSLHFPKFSSTAEEDLRKLTYEGAEKKYPVPLSDEIKKRLDYELDTINSMGFANYILIVWDYCKEAGNKMEDIFGERIISPGRGSGAGSCVLYCLDITGIDPLEYGLIFERFLNPSRVSMPDIDADFAQCIRRDMFRYVEEKYGQDNVTHISTITIAQTKGALRTACSIIEHLLKERDKGQIIFNYEKVFNLSEENLKKIRESNHDRPLLRLGDALSKAYDEALEEINKDEEKKRKAIKPNELTEASLGNVYATFGKEVVDLAIKYATALEGSPTTLGVHAAGCIISDKPVTSYAPVRISETDEGEPMAAIEADMIQAEGDFGLVKMDFLGLITLDVIAYTIKLIRENAGIKIKPESIPLDDINVYNEIFAKGNTAGIFQFESDGMRDTLKRFKPDKFEDIVLINALFRPGPLQYIDPIINIKKGLTKPKYITDSLKPILETTYGYPVYQEQLMQIFNKVAGFSLGESDIIRRALSKKKVEQFKKYQPQFIEGMIKAGTTEKEAQDYWDELLDFANYAFNKSHAAAYSLLAYRCAWLKFYYPKEFACAKLIYSDSSKKEDNKMKEMLQAELKENGVHIITPDFDTVEVNAHIVNDTAITIGLANIKGIGRKVAERIVEIRNDLKSVSLENILSSDISKSELTTIARVGVFDMFNIRRFEIINMINIIKDEKYTGNELTGLINEKEEKIDEMYEALVEESGLDINTIMHHRLAPKELADKETISDMQYNNRIKDIEKVKKEQYELIEQKKELFKLIKEIQVSLEENNFKITLEDKRDERELTGIYLGQAPIEMANKEILASIAQNYGYNLLLNPLKLQDKQEAIFPLLITSGFKKLSKNGNEYIGLVSEGQTYRSFDSEIVTKAIEEGLTEKDTFDFYLIKLQKKGDFINITGILDQIDISKNEIIIIVKNREQAKELGKNRIEPLKLYIEDENKFQYILGEIKQLDRIKIIQ